MTIPQEETRTAMPVFEIVSFHLADGADRNAFLRAAEKTERILQKRDAFRRRYLTCDDEGLWTDIVEWTSMESALQAAEEVSADPDFAEFGSMIDGPSVNMRHTSVLWRIE